MEKTRGYGSLPKATLSRLHMYYRYLSSHQRDFVSSEEMGSALGVLPEQVRKDLSYLRYKGKPRVGYRVSELKRELEEIFGVELELNMAIVGAGRLGGAIANYEGFERYRTRVVALFDKDPAKVGTFVGKLRVMPVEELPRVVKDLKVDVGVICVPPDAAQDVADRLVESGVRAIWNFSPSQVKVPPEVILRDEDITRGLLMIKHSIATRPSKDQDKSPGL